jgi:hypothetical protein
MKQMSKVNRATVVKPVREQVPVQQAGVIGETDLDKVSGGGGASGGVLGDRARG